MNTTFFQLAHRTYPLPTRSTVLLLLLSTDSEADAPPFVFPFDVGVLVIDRWLYPAPSRPIVMASLHHTWFVGCSFTVFFESNFTAAQHRRHARDEASEVLRAAMDGNPNEHGPSTYVEGTSSFDSDYDSDDDSDDDSDYDSDYLKLDLVKNHPFFQIMRPDDTYSVFLMNWLKDHDDGSMVEEIYWHKYVTQ